MSPILPGYQHSPLGFCLGVVLVFATLSIAVRKTQLFFARRSIIRAHGCQAVKKYPLRDPLFGLDYWRELNRAASSRRLLEWLRNQYGLYGNTYYTRLHTTNVISTCEPGNLKVMHSTNFQDFAVDLRRKLAFLPLLGAQSVLLANGATWEHKRAMLKPSFSRAQYQNLPLFERHVANLIRAVKKKGCDINLADFFLCLTVDFTSDVMFGKSVELLVHENPQLVENMTRSAEGGHARWLLVFLAKIMSQPGFQENVSEVRKFMSRYVDEAIEYRKTLNFEKQIDTAGRAIYLQEIARGTVDRKAILDELTTILFAGRDTTAALLTNLFFILAKRPDVWQTLRAEVAELGAQKPSFEKLKSMTYLQNCLKEALRLHPVIPINTRMAVRDTVLPLGGGPNGDAPILVKAGTNIAFHVTALHRRKDLWGEDAEEFRPERWTNLHATWNYQPFGAGPRNCPGQHLSLAEAAYTTLRLVQEFRSIETRDEQPWTELIALTCTNLGGAKVILSPS